MLQSVQEQIGDLSSILEDIHDKISELKKLQLTYNTKRRNLSQQHESIDARIDELKKNNKTESQEYGDSIDERDKITRNYQQIIENQMTEQNLVYELEKNMTVYEDQLSVLEHIFENLYKQRHLEQPANVPSTVATTVDMNEILNSLKAEVDYLLSIEYQIQDNVSKMTDLEVELTRLVKYYQSQITSINENIEEVKQHDVNSPLLSTYHLNIEEYTKKHQEANRNLTKATEILKELNTNMTIHHEKYRDALSKYEKLYYQLNPKQQGYQSRR
ncbi:hypothetical protein RF11_13503 [Thelohanellus kitauei]|uniref:Uncharacterized protein n=1 Tax=Thelohanellus kitauei TaxID=669202 RepID=A0A0C2IV59_THEKT|nr:hypothetical protein RF11_13503 [Thelohanellus kitauei]